MKIFFLSLLIAGLLFFLLYVLIYLQERGKNQVKHRLQHLQQGIERFSMQGVGEEPAQQTLWERLQPSIRAWEKKLLRLAPQAIKDMMEYRILLAGKQGIWNVQSFIGIWLLAMAGMLLLSMQITSSLQIAFIQKRMMNVLALFVGGAVPFAFLNTLIRKRQALILHQLPELLDLLCVSVQAGLSFEGAMSKIIGRMKGPLIDEFERMQHDTRMGMTRRHAMQSLAKRCDVQEVYLFVTAVIQAERLGTSMGKTLVNQADNMRERRRQNAKAEALKAPVKIIFPLVMFIFPALFVVVLLPTLLTLMKNL